MRNTDLVFRKGLDQSIDKISNYFSNDLEDFQLAFANNSTSVRNSKQGAEEKYNILNILHLINFPNSMEKQ